MTAEGDLHARLEALAELLPLLSEALDIRDVFSHVSRISHRVLPHDSLALALIAPDARHLIVHAISGEVDFDRPDRIPIPDQLRRLLHEPWDYLIADDMRSDPVMSQMPPVQAGLRASLRVPMRREGRTIGGLNFMAREVGRFAESDVPVAQRVAAYAALTLAHQDLAQAAARAAEARERAAALEEKVRSLHDELAVLGRGTPRRIVGTSAAWRQCVAEAAQVAPTDTTVLLTGESGTGKEVLARFIHGASPRAHGPFLAINCAALPEPLLESELFGHERGAFTGATHARPGLIEQAAGGVLLLDEVGELSPGAQAKLLRVLQEREFQRVGGSRVLRADVRVIAATHRNLRRMVEAGTFRDDLFYRLHIFAIGLPPLRERPDDVLPLAEALLDDIGRQLGRRVGSLASTAAPALLGYAWPGNIRELRNVLERAAILAGSAPITDAHLALPSAALPPRLDDSRRTDATSPLVTTAGATLPDVERQLVSDALRAARYNKTRAARTLGLTRAQLYVRLRRYGLSD
ncbi:MAG TPA: sigma 54-interacting transcriptional regulator [Luteitalea sp.]|nr:sigma 54-interacting transcriptional regulator [Luteitalea sp.]